MMPWIHPKEYLKMRDEQSKIIADANTLIVRFHDAAKHFPVPTNLRPAIAEDIVKDQIIWYLPDEYNPKGYWKIVQDVLRPSDSWKAYCAEDGCRYGLDGAYVEILA